MAEFRLRRVQTLLARAERAVQNERLNLATPNSCATPRSTSRELEFWQGEVTQLESELAAVLHSLNPEETHGTETEPAGA